MIHLSRKLHTTTIGLYWILYYHYSSNETYWYEFKSHRPCCFENYQKNDLWNKKLDRWFLKEISIKRDSLKYT